MRQPNQYASPSEMSTAFTRNPHSRVFYEGLGVQVKRILSRNRQIPGKATGTTYFDLRWPSGRISKRDEQFHGLKAAIKFLQHRLRDIPQAERNSLSANLYAEVRKSSGGLGR